MGRNLGQRNEQNSSNNNNKSWVRFFLFAEMTKIKISKNLNADMDIIFLFNKLKKEDHFKAQSPLLLKGAEITRGERNHPN